ncbi:phage tail sheath family protein [Paraburkholderia phytofirmans]|uniref:phage tail sheath family protein n=1 Tax=Paraburkholderia phytofirmans TaxID=261302 RepID=UPI0007B60944|nr:phage tail sheath C-terminal domain-containing protein [Paraburkholderia phytofirmans]
MPVTTSFPGVYIDEDASPSISVSKLATSVPVFIGYFSAAGGGSQKFNYNQCIRIASWLDFTTICSSATLISVSIKSTASPAPAAVNGKEASGSSGDTYTYTDSVSFQPNAAYDVQSYFQNGGGPCYILPLKYPAAQADYDAVPSIIDRENDITLLVPTTSLNNALQGVLSGMLTSDKRYFYIAGSSDGSPLSSAQPDQIAMYYPYLTTNYYPYSRSPDASITVSGYIDGNNKTGNEVTNLAQLKSVNPAEYNTVSAEIDQMVSADLSNTLLLAPGAAIAGVYCRTDATRGVWKAPANVALSGFVGASAMVTDDQQGAMNDAGINVIRNFSNRGLIVWGARTLAGTAKNSDTSWRYVPVRRLFNSAERDIKTTMQTMVFEPNNAPTWEKVRSAIENYLYSLWIQGALLGATPKEAYFVQIGLNVTMTADQIAQGQMIATVGMAAVRPAEFIILQFTQSMSS